MIVIFPSYDCDVSFEKKKKKKKKKRIGKVTLDHLYLHTKDDQLSRGVSGLAIDSRCGAWGRVWINDCPLYDVHF